MINNDSTDATLTIAADPIPYISQVATGNWNAPGSWNRNAVPTAGSKVIISSGNTITVNAATAALGDLAVDGTLSVGAFNITVSGTTAVNGTLTHASATGTKTYTGKVTINPGGTWNSGTAPINFRGGVTNNGTFTAGTGVHTFSTNAQAIGGANPISIPNVTVTTVTLTNSGTLSVGTALSGTGGLNNLGTLNIGGTSGITTLTAIPRGNLVNYNGAAQTVRNINYYDLTLSGSGTKTLQTGTGAIAGDLKLLGTVSATTVDNLYVTGDIEVGSGATLTTTGFTLYMGGLVSISGTLTFSTSTAGSKNFYGPVLINPGGRWNSAVNEGFIFRGGFTNNSNAAHAFGTGTYTFNTNVQNIGGTYPISIPSITVTGTTLTNTGTLTVGTALSGTGGLTQGAGATLNIGGASAITTLTATAAGNTVNYTGAAQTGKVTIYNNLTLSGSGAKTFATTPTVNGTLSLEGTASVVVTTGVVTYGPNATLQYNKPAAYTATAEEWISPFAATGGVVIANTGAITMDAAKTLNAGVPLVINSGASLNQNNLALTVGGNYTNNGTQSNTGTMTLNGNGTTIAGTGGSGITGTGTVTVTGNKTVVAGTNLTVAKSVALSANTSVTNNGTFSITSTSGMTGADATTSVWTNAATLP